jgi:hypothetical protein
MDATSTVAPPINFLNVAYFFRLIYDAIFGIHGGGGGGAALNTNWLEMFLSNLWFAFAVLSYLVTLACIGVLVYYSIRLYQIREIENAKIATITPEVAHQQVEHSRWTYIKQLIESPNESDWRQAIIEADVMLDELLTKLGYVGDTVGDKLKMTNPAHFRTLNDAWEAHKVRNEIAHQGSAYKLTDHIAYRTIGHYENVFREFNEI